MNTKRMATVLAAVLFAAGVLCSVFVCAARAQVPQYTAIDLGTLGGEGSHAWAINNSGQVVGWASLPTGPRPVLFSGTGLGNTNLDPLGGNFGFAIAINDFGQIVGQSGLPDNSGHWFAALFSGTGSGNTPLGEVGSFARDINNAGQMVGHGGVTGQIGTRAVIFSGTGANNFNLGTLGGLDSYASAINNAGQIVGYASDADGRNHAALFSGTGSGNTDLGTLGGDLSWAYDINDYGQIVGYGYTDPARSLAIRAPQTTVLFMPSSIATEPCGTFMTLLLEALTHARSPLISGTRSTIGVRSPSPDPTIGPARLGSPRPYSSIPFTH